MLAERIIGAASFGASQDGVSVLEFTHGLRGGRVRMRLQFLGPVFVGGVDLVTRRIRIQT